MVSLMSSLLIVTRMPKTGMDPDGEGVFAGLRTSPKIPTTSRRMARCSGEFDAQTGMKRSSTYLEAGKRNTSRRMEVMASPRRPHAYTAETAPKGMAHWVETETTPLDGSRTKMLA